MHKFLRVVILTVAPRETRCSFNDMLSQAHHTAALIRQASSFAILMLLEDKITQIADYYCRISQTPYHINKLRTLILMRRCELITTLENEEV